VIVKRLFSAFCVFEVMVLSFAKAGLDRRHSGPYIRGRVKEG
jgi:hypothetical protein